MKVSGSTTKEHLAIRKRSQTKCPNMNFGNGDCRNRGLSQPKAASERLSSSCRTLCGSLSHCCSRDTLRGRAYRRLQGNTLVLLGDEFGDNLALGEAIRLFRAIAVHDPLDWAATQNSLGNALETLGGAGERDGASGGGGRGLSRRAGGTDPPARSASMGDDAEQSRQCALEARGAGERDGEAYGGVRRHREALKEMTPQTDPTNYQFTMKNLTE
jgi:hypothetical protein